MCAKIFTFIIIIWWRHNNVIGRTKISIINANFNIMQYYWKIFELDCNLGKNMQAIIM